MPCFLSRWHGAGLDGAHGGAFQCWLKWSSMVHPQSWGNTVCLSPLPTLGFSSPSPQWWTYSVHPHLLLLTLPFFSQACFISSFIGPYPTYSSKDHWRNFLTTGATMKKLYICSLSAWVGVVCVWNACLLICGPMCVEAHIYMEVWSLYQESSLIALHLTIEAESWLNPELDDTASLASQLATGTLSASTAGTQEGCHAQPAHSRGIWVALRIWTLAFMLAQQEL